VKIKMSCYLTVVSGVRGSMSALNDLRDVRGSVSSW
jgi:hypothetical protein